LAHGPPALAPARAETDKHDELMERTTSSFFMAGVVNKQMSAEYASQARQKESKRGARSVEQGEWGAESGALV
jgi:hypothetical protein